MRRYILLLNAAAVADFVYLATAKKSFSKFCQGRDPETDSVELVSLVTGELIASNQSE